ncbi:MAG: LysE family translocator [Burkholderiales bacterium]|jgi:threonine/homoserine/homoserine lactone efflux protein|nr:LysE family translocator [Rhodocyclaceae bacterium]MCA3021086.1 LysE family translocator [Rhodocyclaceae bacterium]MCA3054353.1 LysE family translocator [Rhodocyclaceae bacterium]
MFSTLGIHDLPLFIAAGLLLNLTPGPDMVYIGSRTALGGFRAGLAAVLGIAAGCMMHSIAAAVGLSAILLTSAEAFFVVKMVGAAYLVYAGVQILRSATSMPVTTQTSPPATTASPTSALPQVSGIFWQGFMTNVLNPKVAIFFLAFLPQFIDMQSANKAWAFLILGVIFVFNSMFITIGFAAIVAKARGKISTTSSLAVWLNRGCGAMFLALGAKLAVTERPI